MAYPPRLLSQRELDSSLVHTMRDRNPRHDVWVFAYGSLIFDPQIEFVERAPVRAYGYHRGFYIWSPIYRGTFEQPGLVLGLDRGGCCRGIAYRIAARHAREQLRLLWRRELLVGSYQPAWLRVRDGEGGGIETLGFVINRAGAGYAGRRGEAEMLNIMLNARGRRGPCYEYVLRTVAALREHGIEDRKLARLERVIRQRLAAAGLHGASPASRRALPGC